MGLNVLLLVLNILLLRRMHFENIAWPIIAVAIPASLYLTVIDFALYYSFWWWNFDVDYVFSHRIGIYKTMIAIGLVLSLIRPPVVYLKLRPRRTVEEKLGGKN
jgi:hypothetical protein